MGFLPLCSPPLATTVSNEEAWQHGRLLQVGKTAFFVDRDPPSVEKVLLTGGHAEPLSNTGQKLLSDFKLSLKQKCTSTDLILLLAAGGAWQSHCRVPDPRNGYSEPASSPTLYTDASCCWFLCAGTVGSKLVICCATVAIR